MSFNGVGLVYELGHLSMLLAQSSLFILSHVVFHFSVWLFLGLLLA